MKLVSLTLEYFRQYRAVTVPFADGLTGIIGPNGAGKTTLLEGIAFALFGSRGLRGKVDEVLQRGAPRGSVPLAQLTFEHDGQVFRVERRGGEASLYQGGEPTPLASGSRDVSSFVSGVVRMSYEEFFATYFTEQKGLEFLSGQKGAAERERFIVRLLGYDRFEKVQELLRAERRDIKTDLMGRESALGERAQLEQRLEREVRETSALEKALLEAAQSLAQVETQAAQAKRGFLEIEARRVIFQKAAVELKELEARVAERVRLESSLQAQGESLHVRELAQREALGISPQADWKGVREQLAQHLKELSDLRRAGEKELKEREQEWQRLQSEAETKLRVVEAQHSERCSRVERLRALTDHGECPTCGQVLGSGFEGVLTSQGLELSLIDQAKIEATQTFANAKSAPAMVTELRNKLQASGEAEEAARARATAFETINQVSQERASISERLAALSSETAALVAQAEQLRQAAAQSNFSEEQYLREKAAFETSQSLESTARLRRVKVEGEHGAKQGMAERTRAELVTFDGKRRELEQRKELLVTLDESDTFLTDFRSYVNGSIRPRLAELASEFITELTDGRYTAVEVARDFSPTVIEDGEQKAVISGGEEDILNLCMRFALSQMLAERAGHTFSLMVLDEVFGSLDEQRRINVLQLMEKLSERFEQILIVTHLDDVKEGVRHLYQVEYDEATGLASVRGQNHSYEVELAEAV